jgi:hypothetical protein
MTGGPRAVLRLVYTSDEAVTPWQWFCSHCGTAGLGESAPASRVCERCQLGLMLTAPAEATPTEHDAFLVIDNSLTVQAMSYAAECMLAISEHHAVNRLVTELLIPASIDSPDHPGLATAIVEAASGDGQVKRVVVRPSRTFGIRLEGRIAPCGDPPAALLILS